MKSVRQQIEEALANSGVSLDATDVQIEIQGAGPNVRILVNDKVTMSPKKMAAQAVHAALAVFGVDHGSVVVLGGKPSQIEKMAAVIRDAGRTELKPGTLTAGATLEHDAPDVTA